jgi:hypothetical protein
VETAASFGGLPLSFDSKFAKAKDPLSDVKETRRLNFPDLLATFEQIQTQHAEMRREALSRVSLIKSVPVSVDDEKE